MAETVKKKERDSRGRFAKGNPGGGRPRNTKAQNDALQQLRDLSPIAVDTMRRILADPDASSAIKVKIAEIILDRTYGKPRQDVDATISNGEDFVLEIVGGDADGDNPA